jgi:hypothetical protein
MLANIVLSLRDIVNEPVRCLIARRFAAAIQHSITDENVQKRFLDVGIPYFLRLCEVEDGNPFVPDDLHVEATELARFCNRWMTIQSFRDPGEEAWQPITSDMNSLRCTMVAELQALSEGATVEQLNEEKNG